MFFKFFANFPAEEESSGMYEIKSIYISYYFVLYTQILYIMHTVVVQMTAF